MGKFQILVAEDDDNDRLLLSLAFKAAGVNAEVQFVEDGVQAIEYLKGRGRFGEREKFPFPDLLLLDAHMPRVDGFEVLEWLRNQHGVGRLPVIMLSSSNLQRDVDRAHALGVNGYTVKRCGMQGMSKLVGRLGAFWLKEHRYPSCCASSRNGPTSAAPERLRARS